MEIFEEKQAAHKDEIDLLNLVDDMWKGFRKFWELFLTLIIICTIVFTGINILRYQPVYESYVTFVVNKNQTSEGDSLVAARLANSFDYVLASGGLTNTIKNDLEIEEDEDIPATIFASNLEDTNFLTITAQSEDAEQAEAVIESIARNYPSIAPQVAGTVELISLDRSGEASEPMSSFQPVVTVLKGLLIGCVLTLVILAVMSLMDSTIRRYDDLKKYMSIPNLGTIPVIRFKKRKKIIDTAISIMNEQAPQSFKESINTIRTRVEKEMKQKKCHSLMVTSSIPGEGKSTIAANLAVALSQRSKKILLIDLDLRHPSLYKMFGITDAKIKKGITDLLKGRANFDDVVYSELLPNLDLVCGEKSVANPSAILSSSIMKKLLEEVKDYYDYIIIDTPPSAMISDALSIADKVDAVLYVVRQDYVKSRHLREGIGLLAGAETEIIGCVLNYAEAGITHYGYGKYGYGKYGYEKYKNE